MNDFSQISNNIAVQYALTLIALGILMLLFKQNSKLKQKKKPLKVG